MQQNDNIHEEIKKIQEEIYTLKEYLLSDCCKQCSEIVDRIERYQTEIIQLKTQLAD